MAILVACDSQSTPRSRFDLAGNARIVQCNYIARFLFAIDSSINAGVSSRGVNQVFSSEMNDLLQQLGRIIDDNSRYGRFRRRAVVRGV
jgi:hypothetical protein